MRSLLPIAVAVTLFAAPALADQDGPMRKAGSFAARVEGVVTGSLTGDATIFVRKDGTHLYLTANSDQMMTLKTMISAEIVWPTHSSASRYQIPDGAQKSSTTAVVQWENLDTRERHSATATGFVELDARDLKSGRFELTAKDGAATLKFSGTFKDVPTMDGIN